MGIATAFAVALFLLIKETTPLDPNFTWPVPTTFRYPDYYRFVAPVIEAIGLNPHDLLLCDEHHESRTEYQELFRFLARESQRRPGAPFPPDELVTMIPRWGYPSLASVCSESLDMIARIAAMRGLFAKAPTMCSGVDVDYRLISTHDGRPGQGKAYRVETIEKGV